MKKLLDLIQIYLYTRIRWDKNTGLTNVKEFCVGKIWLFDIEVLICDNFVIFG